LQKKQPVHEDELAKKNPEDPSCVSNPKLPVGFEVYDALLC